MSAVSTTVTIDLTEAQAALVRADKALAGGMAGGLAIAGEKVAHDHLRANYVNKPNRLGATSTGYWDAVDKSITGETEQNGNTFTTTVSLSGVGIWMKYNGGIIKPTGRPSTIYPHKPIQFLTIPQIAAAHGKTVSDFEHNRAEGQPPFFTRKDGGLYHDGTLYFLLAKSVKIKADTNILPPASAVTAEMTAAIQAALD